MPYTTLSAYASQNKSSLKSTTFYKYLYSTSYYLYYYKFSRGLMDFMCDVHNIYEYIYTIVIEIDLRHALTIAGLMAS